LADVFLDTYPYNCGSTSNDVVHAGLPLITMAGQTLVSRMGQSLLNELGRQSMVVCGYKDYEKKVVQLSRLKVKKRPLQLVQSATKARLGQSPLKPYRVNRFSNGLMNLIK
jgi:predicted O-linked N-acetylglucosamine transferase (SPINDLY family)